MKNLSNEQAVLVKNNFSVVLIEDDHNLRHEIEAHLMANQFKVSSVSSAASLNSLALPDPIDLYVIDLNLPGESGLSLSRRIRSQFQEVGIVIITAKPGLGDKLASYSYGGADFYLQKPVSPDELVLVLQSLGRRVKKNIN
jgi:DNA-binding response OmpR family regulator